MSANSAGFDLRVLDAKPCFTCSTFVVAGVDSTSNAVSRVLWLLSGLPEVQDKLRAEIREAQEQYGKEILYDEIMTLPLLDAICRETLRL